MSLRPWVFVAAVCWAPWPSLPAQQFVQQTLIVAPLQSGGDTRLARDVASRLRSRIARLSNRRELRVLAGDTTEQLLEFAGFGRDAVLNEAVTLDLARLLRADEVVVGRVEGRRGGPVTVRVELALTRDWRLRQPLPEITAATPSLAADSLAVEVVRARSQMDGLRRCENAAREANPSRAVAEAARAVAAYARSTLARTCLGVSLAMEGTGADSVLAVARVALEVDSTNVVLATLAAEALSALARPAEAALAWRKVVRLRPDSLELGTRAVEWMVRLRRPTDAMAAGRLLLERWKDEPELRRLLFRALAALPDNPGAAALGDSLDQSDSAFRDDSVLDASHIAALSAVGDTLGAVAKSARSVKLHPRDPILYLQYLQLVAGENGPALRRGIERFPAVPDLRVLAAAAARGAGNAAGELASLRDAVRLDSTMTRGYLRMAELWFATHRADSALAVLARTPRSGAEAELLRSYAIGRGLQLLRSASDTTDATWKTTITLLALADSVDSRQDTRGMLAASALQRAQRSLSTAAKSGRCSDARIAVDALSLAGSVIERGVGEGSDAHELHDAFSKLNEAAQKVTAMFCTG